MTGFIFGRFYKIRIKWTVHESILYFRIGDFSVEKYAEQIKATMKKETKCHFKEF